MPLITPSLGEAWAGREARARDEQIMEEEDKNRKSDEASENEKNMPKQPETEHQQRLLKQQQVLDQQYAEAMEDEYAKREGGA